jgi:tripeptide aminopeptidase
MDLSFYREEMIQRFFKYVKFDTQSSETSETYPSTKKQKDLGKVLVNDLIELGLENVQMDDYGYVTATLPANSPKKVKTIGLIAHMDTSPDVSGKNVKPILHDNYQGEDIQLPNDSSQIIRFAENPDLQNQIGNTIITSDGTTLLGADNKAGITEIFTALIYLVDHAEIKHGKIRVAITPDEEVGTGTKYFDVDKFAADFAYTIDGESAGKVENETFCADSVNITFKGVNVHPGYAKNKLINAIKIATEFIDKLPKDSLSPETTEKREGYVHPHSISGGVEATTVKLLIRDFTTEGLKEKEDVLEKLATEVVKKYPRAKLDFEVQESYRNMKYKLDEEPEVTEFALKAVERAGIKPKPNIIRGGTDGARLSFAGLLTPNVFTGGHNFHSKLEWISVEDMLKSTETIVHLAQIWEEDGE